MNDDRGNLLDLLVRRVAAHDDPFRIYRPGLGALVAGRPVPPLFEVLEALDETDDAGLIELRETLDQRLLYLARRARALREEGGRIGDALRFELGDLDAEDPGRERKGLERLETAAVYLARGEWHAYARIVETTEAGDVPWQYVPWREACRDFGLEGLTLPEGELEPSAEDVVADPVQKRRAGRRRAAECVLQHGTPGDSPAEVLANHRRSALALAEELRRRGQRLADRFPEVLVRIVVDLSPEGADAMREGLRRREEPETVDAIEVAREPEPVEEQEPEPQPRPEPVVPPPAPPDPEPERPSIWREHLQPFLLDNWYVAIGALMVVVGSSLVAFFTWDRHWAIRYTILPALLGAFTATLAWLGRWLERRDATLTGTGAVLRGAAIALLPINFMTVALLADDPRLELPLLVPLAAALYLGLFGFGLRRWCAGVHPKLGGLLGGTLTLLCALVLLRPLATTLAVSEPALRSIVAVGFHVGFAGLAAAVLAFTSRVLDPDLARAKRVPWFFGATLAITFLQVFAWVHVSLGQLPHVSTYAPLILLAGALLLHTERKVLSLSDRSDRLGAESFLGYAIVLLGLLMSQSEPHVRVLGFALAGVVWLRQATPRGHALHAWIGLTLLALAGASVSLLPGFPGEWRGGFGLGLGLASGASAALFARRGATVLAETARHLQVVLVVLGSVVAMLAQWHYGSAPLATAALLGLSAAVLFVRAHREGRERWVLTAAVQLALALPYLGCVDLAGRTWNGNTMVFGLGTLSVGWIALDLVRPTKLTRSARSTVLWFWGALAVAGMSLRVVLEEDSLHPLMDHTGPLLAALALGFATYWSRSLIPAGMAAAILVILFPELRAQYRSAFEELGWGSGLGSAVSASVLLVVSFLLRRLPALRELGPGDRFLGRAPFPLGRHDWTLFTWPIVASVLFLLVKTQSFTLVRNLELGMTTRAGIAQVLCAATWIGLAAYSRRRGAADWAVWIGFFQLFVGLYAWPAEEFLWSRPLLIGGLVVQAFGLVVNRFGSDSSRRLFAAPASALIRWGAFVAAPGCVAALLFRVEPVATQVLAGGVAAALVAAAVRSGRWIHAVSIFPLILALVLYWTRGDAATVIQTSPWHFVVTSGAVALGFQLQDALIAGRPARLLQPILRPAHAWSVALALVSVVYGIAVVVLGLPHDTLGLIVLATAAFAVARAHRSGFFFLLGSLATYCFCTANPERLLDLFLPWRLGLLAALLAAAGAIGERIPGRWLGGKEPVRFDPVPPRFWIAGASAAIAIAAVALQLGIPEWRASAEQLPAAYLAAAALFFASRLVRQREAGYAVAAALAIANVQLVRVLAGDWLASIGVTPIQTVALGLLSSLALALILRRRVRATDVVDRSAAFLASGLLVLLAVQYVAHPDLAAMTTTRLLVSGGLAYGAAFAFRTLARSPHEGAGVSPRFAESAYHLGLTVALWCVALLVPWFRQPSAALVALAVPFFFFVLRADLLRGDDRQRERGYVDSASVLGYLLLGLYLLRGVFQLVLFPGTTVLTEHYHHNSVLLMAVGLGLLRLHVHGGFWRAFYGGVALIAGSYFAVTSFPGLSIFERVVPAGWVLIVLVHFWTVASHQRSPLRTGLQELAGIDDEEWHALRRGWGLVLLVAAQVPPLLAALDATGDTRAIAPLCVGAASVVLHHGVLRRRPLYFVLGAIEILFALHLDLLVPSYLPWRAVIWILLGGWAGMLVWNASRPERLPLRAMKWASIFLAAAVLGHVLLHGPSSAVGWSGFFCAVGLLLATPRASARWGDDATDAWTAALLLAPVWLAYFATAAGREVLDAWPALAALVALLTTGAAGAWIGSQELDPAEPERPLLGHRLFDLARRHGDWLGRIALYATFLASTATFAIHYLAPFEPRELVCLVALFAGCAVGFHLDGRARRAMLPYYLMQLAVLALFAAIRRQLILTTDFWTMEYDVWAACLTTVALAGAKEIWDLRPRAVGVPVTTALFALPVLAMIWTLVHGLGVNVALLVLGVHSLTYSFLGKDDRESPYNLVAVGGFVGFVMISFWAKLELRSVQAFVIPVGIGILVLAQLFRARLAPGVRNLVRFVAVAAMIGSAAYEALLDPRYPVAFHVSLLLLGIFGLTLGGFLRVRVYLWTGCAGIGIALASITYRGLAGLEQAARMSAVGVLVLLLGASLVAGAIYYKTHRDRVNAVVERWRTRLGEWD